MEWSTPSPFLSSAVSPQHPTQHQSLQIDPNLHRRELCGRVWDGQRQRHSFRQPSLRGIIFNIKLLKIDPNLHRRELCGCVRDGQRQRHSFRLPSLRGIILNIKFYKSTQASSRRALLVVFEMVNACAISFYCRLFAVVTSGLKLSTSTSAASKRAAKSCLDSYLRSLSSCKIVKKLCSRGSVGIRSPAGCVELSVLPGQQRRGSRKPEYTSSESPDRELRKP